MSNLFATSMAVAVRLRPMNRLELECRSSIAVKRTPDGLPHVSVDFHGCFAFNYVFDQSDTQKDLFETCVQSKLKRLLQGYDVTILAYGQTGFGKTYTMGTDFNGVMDDNVGLIPRAVHYIFRYIETQKNSYNFRVSCSFVKIYQEQLFDLLLPRNNLNSRLVGPGLTELEVTSAQEVTDHLMRGFAKRAVSENPSESHSIFTLTMVARKLGGGGTTSETTAKINFVDLAGSGRWTLATGDRSKEGLVALGNVMNALACGEIAAEYIPYRQSMLTNLLQDSLGGRSITLLIACVSSADVNVSETLRTLRFADRTLPIMNKPGVRLDQQHEDEVSRLKDIIQQLRGELLRAKQAADAADAADAPDDHQSLEDRVKSLEEKNLKLHEELEQILIDTADADVRGGTLAGHIVQSKMHVSRIMRMLGIQRQEERGPQSVQSEGNHLLQALIELNRIASDTTEQIRQRYNLYLQTHSQESWQQFNLGGGDFGSEASAAGPEDHVPTQQQANDEYY